MSENKNAKTPADGPAANRAMTLEEVQQWITTTWLRCQDEVWRQLPTPKKVSKDDQEPVAFINVEKQKLEWAKLTSWHTPTIVNLPKIPLYTAPPKKEWVGLTDEEKEKLVEAFYGTDIQRLEAIEARLKEKNT